MDIGNLNAEGVIAGLVCMRGRLGWWVELEKSDDFLGWELLGYPFAHSQVA